MKKSILCLSLLLGFLSCSDIQLRSTQKFVDNTDQITDAHLLKVCNGLKFACEKLSVSLEEYRKRFITSEEILDIETLAGMFNAIYPSEDNSLQFNDAEGRLPSANEMSAVQNAVFSDDVVAFYYLLFINKETGSLKAERDIAKSLLFYSDKKDRIIDGALYTAASPINLCLMSSGSSEFPNKILNTIFNARGVTDQLYSPESLIKIIEEIFPDGSTRVISVDNPMLAILRYFRDIQVEVSLVELLTKKAFLTKPDNVKFVFVSTNRDALSIEYYRSGQDYFNDDDMSEKALTQEQINTQRDLYKDSSEQDLRTEIRENSEITIMDEWTKDDLIKFCIIAKHLNSSVEAPGWHFIVTECLADYIADQADILSSIGVKLPEEMRKKVEQKLKERGIDNDNQNVEREMKKLDRDILLYTREGKTAFDAWITLGSKVAKKSLYGRIQYELKKIGNNDRTFKPLRDSEEKVLLNLFIAKVSLLRERKKIDTIKSSWRV